MPVGICGKKNSPTKWWFDNLGIPGFQKKNSKVWFAVCPGLMNSPVKSAQLFHLPRFPASAWQRKAKLASVYDYVTLWQCLTVWNSTRQSILQELLLWCYLCNFDLGRLSCYAWCRLQFVFFSLFIIRRWIPPNRMSPEERRPNDNTAKVFQMKWSILGHFLGADQEVLTIYHDGNDIQEIFSREVVTT